MAQETGPVKRRPVGRIPGSGAIAGGSRYHIRIVTHPRPIRLELEKFIVTPELFDEKVAEALDLVPIEFQKKMENVEVTVEDFPDPDTLRSLGLRSKWDLLGLYVGVPISERSFFANSPLPERIFLYRRPILRAAAGGTGNVPEVIRDVLIHEIGHHFGFSDDELYEMSGDED